MPVSVAGKQGTDGRVVEPVFQCPQVLNKILVVSLDDVVEECVLSRVEGFGCHGIESLSTPDAHFLVTRRLFVTTRASVRSVSFRFIGFVDLCLSGESAPDAYRAAISRATG